MLISSKILVKLNDAFGELVSKKDDNYLVNINIVQNLNFTKCRFGELARRKDDIYPVNVNIVQILVLPNAASASLQAEKIHKFGKY